MDSANIYAIEEGEQAAINITVADTGEIDVITLEGPDILLEKLNEPVAIAEETTIWREFVPLDIADGIGVSDTQVFFLPELNLPEIELTISVADSGEIQPTELHLDVSQPVVVTESSVLFLPELVLPVVEAIGIAETGEIAPTELHLDVTQPVTVADESGIDVEAGSIVTISISEGIGVSEYAAPVVKYCIYIRDEATIFRPTLNVSVSEGIGVAESSTRFFLNITPLGVDDTITLAETSIIHTDYLPISVAEAISAADSATLGEAWTPGVSTPPLSPNRPSSNPSTS